MHGGHGRASQRSWGVWSQGTPSHRKVKKVENLSRFGGLTTDAETSYGKRGGVPKKLGGVLRWHQGPMAVFGGKVSA